MSHASPETERRFVILNFHALLKMPQSNYLVTLNLIRIGHMRSGTK